MALSDISRLVVLIDVKVPLTVKLPEITASLLTFNVVNAPVLAVVAPIGVFSIPDSTIFPEPLVVIDPLPAKSILFFKYRLLNLFDEPPKLVTSVTFGLKSDFIVVVPSITRPLLILVEPAAAPIEIKPVAAPPKLISVATVFKRLKELVSVIILVEIVGLVANTANPVPVLVVSAEIKLALVGVAKNAEMPEANPVILDRGKAVALVKTRAEGVPKSGVTSTGLLAKTRLPVPVDVLVPEPPLATANIPLIVRVPDPVIGPPVTVKPVVPPDSATEVTVPVLAVAPVAIPSSLAAKVLVI